MKVLITKSVINPICILTYHIKHLAPNNKMILSCLSVRRWVKFVSTIKRDVNVHVTKVILCDSSVEMGSFSSLYIFLYVDLLNLSGKRK